MADYPGDFNLSRNAAVSASMQLRDGAETHPRMLGYDAVTMTAGEVDLIALIAPRSFTATRFVMATRGTAQLGATLVRIGLYREDSSGLLTLVARTANDPTLFVATNTAYSKAFDTAGGFPASFPVVGGQLYRAGYIVVGAAPAGILTGVNPNSPTVNTVTIRDQEPPAMKFIVGQTDLALTYGPGGLTNYGGMPYVALMP
jgi:hypothetical protein